METTETKPKKVSELLSSEKRWTKGAYARTADDNPVPERMPEACKWCLLGAIYVTSTNNEDLDTTIKRVAQHVTGDDYEGGLIKWNDDPRRTFAEVCAVVDALDL